MNKKVAWKVEIRGMHCICFAETKSKAQWIATKGYWEAYGKALGWPRARATRAPMYDTSELRLNDIQKCYDEDYITP